MHKRIALFFVMLIFSAYSFACQTDADCSYGSSCFKSPHIKGICVGGMNPGNSNDKQPYAGNGTLGNTCTADSECGNGFTCFKSRNSIRGACIHQ